MKVTMGTKDPMVGNRKSKDVQNKDKGAKTLHRDKLMASEVQEEVKDISVSELQYMLEDLSLSSKLRSSLDANIQNQDNNNLLPATLKEVSAQIFAKDNATSLEINREQQINTTLPLNENSIQLSTSNETVELPKNDWQDQIKKLEKKLEVTRKYEAELDTKANQFLESALLVPGTDLEVRVCAQSDGNEVQGTWFILHGILPSSHAWLGLFPLRSTKSPVEVIRACSTAGEFHFRHLTPGHYNVRFFGDKVLNSYITETPPIIVGPKVESFSAKVQNDEILLIQYEFGKSFARSSSDWVGIYEKSQRRNKQYIRCAYFALLGKVEIKLPHSPGVYEARLFAKGANYNEQATVEFEVIDTDYITAKQVNKVLQVAWRMKRVATTKSDWVGLYTPESAPTNYIAFDYTHGNSTGEISLKVPANLPNGDYELRLFSSKVGKYTPYKVTRVTLY